MREKRDRRKKDAATRRTKWKVMKFSPQEWTVLMGRYAIWRQGKGDGRSFTLSGYIRSQVGL